MYLFVYLSLAIGTLIISVGRAILFFYAGLKSSKKSFEEMLTAVFRSPMSFFQSNPHGRIMNRFSKDINLMDEMLPQTFFDFTQCSFLILSVLVIAVAVVPYSLIIVPFIGGLFYYLRKMYVTTSRQIKRLEATTRSPVYSNVPSTIEGLSIIRAFSAQQRLHASFNAIQNENTRIFFAYLSCGRWLGFRLDFLQAILVLIFVFGCILMRDILHLSPSSLGLLLSYLMQLTGLLQWCFRQSSEVENLMVSTERVFEYALLPSEAPPQTDVKPPLDWPTAGHVDVRGMSLTYPNLEKPSEEKAPVLKNISVQFEPGMKVGIVGRTGAGKSSFLQALFRLVEPQPAKSIVIDNICTSDIGLSDLRSRISIIPQEPFCFKVKISKCLILGDPSI
jgi:ATP-binding cassette subfamily C (CFTR/MRP) protein 4